MPPQKLPAFDGVVREAERARLTGVPISSWYVLMSRGEAPKPISIGARSIGWIKAELTQWAEDRRAQRDARAARQKRDIRRSK